MNLQDRINQLIADRKERASVFSRGVGVSRATVSDWTTGKIPTISAENARKVADYCRSTVEWVAFGKGSKYIEGEIIRPNLPAPESNYPEKSLSKNKQQTIENLKKLLEKEIDPMDEVLLQQIIENVSRKYQDD